MIRWRAHPWRLSLAGWALALLLALGQQHAVLHWVAHAVAEASPHAKHASESACPECVAVAAFGAGAATACVFVAACPARYERITHIVADGAAQRTRIPYLSRAPPPSF